MLKSISRLTRSIALTITIMYGALITPEVHNKYLRWEVGESVVQVLSMTSNGGGTGFAVKGKSGKDYIMTNHHVCESQEEGKIRIKVGDKAPVVKNVIVLDDVHDLYLIEGIKDLSALSIGSDLETGDYLYVVGHPGLRKLTTSSGEFIGIEFIELIKRAESRADCPGKVYDAPPIYQILTGKDFICTREYESLATTAVIYPGNSGSPVVNKWGNLIGVAFAGSSQQERDNYIVPLKYIKSLLNKF